MIPTLPTASGEGNTPLVTSRRIARELGIARLLFKLENINPTGSYKDRFIAAEVGRLLAAGARQCLATSSGNTGASLAAYCARFEIRCTIVVGDQTPAGKLVQMAAHGARLIRVRGFTTDPAVTRQAMAQLADLARDRQAPLVVSAYRYCPEGMAGVESLGRELAGHAGHVLVPAGSGGLFIATGRGLAGAAARVHAVQPAGCSTFVAAARRGGNEIVPVASRTAISGLSVPFDIDASLALAELRARGGLGFEVSDEEVYEAQRMMMELEGIYAEPAGAAALAGLRAALASGEIGRDASAICIVSGHGFKDPDAAAAAAARHPAVLIDLGALAATID